LAGGLRSEQFVQVQSGLAQLQPRLREVGAQSHRALQALGGLFPTAQGPQHPTAVGPGHPVIGIRLHRPVHPRQRLLGPTAPVGNQPTQVQGIRVLPTSPKRLLEQPLGAVEIANAVGIRGGGKGVGLWDGHGLRPYPARVALAEGLGAGDFPHPVCVHCVRGVTACSE